MVSEPGVNPSAPLEPGEHLPQSSADLAGVGQSYLPSDGSPVFGDQVGAYPAGIGAVMPVMPRPVALPVEPLEYHQFYRAPAFRWWKPLAAVALFFVVVVLIIVIAAVGYVVAILASGGTVADLQNIRPANGFALNNVVLGLWIPVALLLSWLVFRQRPRWLSSVAGGFRWRAFWRLLAIAGVALTVSLVVSAQFSGGFGELSWNQDTVFLLVVIVFTTPLQSAGEEYAMRGLLNRSIGSWFANRWTGLVVGGLINSAVFMALHGAGDAWLNAYYLLVGLTFSILVWRTGGLEAAIALHIANNLVSEALLPFSPESLAQIFNRQAGVAGPEIMIQMAITVVVAALLLWQSSRLGLGRSAAPGVIVE